MRKPQYYFLIHPASKSPKFSMMSVNAFSYDVFVGDYADVKHQLLGYAGMSAQAYDNERDVMLHFQRHFGPDKAVRFYDASAGEIYTMRNCGDGQFVRAKQISIDGTSEGEDDSSITLPSILDSVVSKKSSRKPFQDFQFSGPKTAHLMRQHGLFRVRPESSLPSRATEQAGQSIPPRRGDEGRRAAG